MEGTGKKVCVTGASGFIASWLVKMLLDRGYTVSATVRNLDDPKKVDHLRALDGAAERLELVAANLHDEGSFDGPMKGCVGVFHTASPVKFTAADPEKEILEPAVKGTLDVLKSCARTPSVKRVVVTSSMASVLFDGRPLSADAIVDETWQSDPDICRKDKQFGNYVLSKTLAEEAAWKFARESGIDMVTINPAMVIGPLLQPTLNFSSAAVLSLIGAETFPNFSAGWLHVKDVAEAHIKAFEIPSASGRYCMGEPVVHYSKIVSILHELFPSLQLPQKCADDEPYAPEYMVSQEKAKTLVSDFIPLNVSLKETVQDFIDKGFI